MGTNRQLISDVRATNRLLDSDGRINDRTVLNMLRMDALTLINQKTNKRLLWNTDTIFTPIPCVEMEQVPLGSCCAYSGPINVSRSKKKLPTIADGNFQYVIKGVYDVGLSQELKPADIGRYLNILKLNLKTKDVFYWIHDRYLYISSPFVTLAKIIAQFEGDIPYDILFPECDCGGDKKHPCTSRLDEEFKIPGTLKGTTVDMTSRRLLQTYFNITEDKTSDNKDDQTKNRT